MTRLRGQQVGRWWGAGGGLQKRFKIRKVFLVEFKGDQDGFLVVIVQDLILKRVVEGQDCSKTEKMKSDGARNGSPFKAMTKKYGVTEAQVLLRWGVQKGYLILP